MPPSQRTFKRAFGYFRGESVDLKCPVCISIPEGIIYQCLNGHSICPQCVKGLKSCPVCRVKYTKAKIRNLTLENVIAHTTINCYFRKYGCKTLLPTGYYQQHVRTCNFFPVKICKFIGYEDCKYIPRDASKLISHLTDHHQVIRVNGGSMKREFLTQKLQKLMLFNQDFHRDRIFDVNINPEVPAQYLLRYDGNFAEDKWTISILFLGQGISPYDVTINVNLVVPEKEEHTIGWGGKPVHYKNARVVKKDPQVVVPLSLLSQHMCSDEDREKVCSVSLDISFT